MDYNSHANVYYKFGTVRLNPKEAIDTRQIVARFEVGPAGAQISLGELREAAQGKSIRKQHFDGQTTTNRIDAQVIVGDGQDQWKKSELSEIYEIEKAKADARPVPPTKSEDLQAQVAMLQRQLNDLLTGKEAEAKGKRVGRPPKDASQ